MKLLKLTEKTGKTGLSILMAVLVVGFWVGSVGVAAGKKGNAAYPPKVAQNIFNGCTNACVTKAGDTKRVLCSESCQCFSSRLPTRLPLDRMNAYENAVKEKRPQDPAVSKIISTLAHQCAQEVLTRLNRKPQK